MVGICQCTSGLRRRSGAEDPDRQHGHLERRMSDQDGAHSARPELGRP